ncbi:hypothetical protein [Brumimicrobium oceani]|uniref:Secretion system C-terminal sorting domain-containing protein n=1 Tax=Brumimicrobium oceani TaxID=2100725 RepID=A0A2U2XDB7_9FLAO|nr:hypothetical protein [Brumimicrobium oceani]PWH85768.1 hypothetical protein DIT68_06655 [Brumimicrobium oceani]
MKKKLFLLFFLMSGGLSGQQTPEFSFEVYFEDAIGNKDTVTVGYDVNATKGIDSVFGEVNLENQSWSQNNFEVFVNAGGSKRSKIQIVKNECSTNWQNTWANGISFITNSTNRPIKVSYKKEDIENVCMNTSFFWADAEPTWHLLQSLNDFSGTDPLNSFHILDQIYYYDFNKKIEGSDTIYAIHFVFADQIKASELLSVSQTKTNETIQIVPNPFTNGIKIANVEFNTEVNIKDSKGISIKYERFGDVIYPLNCSKGIYYISFLSNNKLFTYKILKI